MIDLSDLTFVSPVCVDSPDRLENIEAVVAFLGAHCVNHRFIIVESAPVATLGHLAREPGVRHVHVGRGGAFHRTRLLNEGMRDHAATRFVASYDADVFAHPDALDAAMRGLRDHGGAAAPFNGSFIDVRGAARSQLIEARGARAVWSATAKMAGAADIVCVNPNSVGGVIIFERRAFIACGGYNENFVSWGWEDNELFARCAKLGVPWRRIPEYPLLHLAHWRGPDSGTRNPYFRGNVREYRRIARMTPEALRATVEAGGLVAARPPEPRWSDLAESGARTALAATWAALTGAK